MGIPNTFQNQTGPIPLAELDANFTATRTDFASTTNATLGSALVGWFKSLANFVGRTLSAKLSDQYSVCDYGAVGDGATDNTTFFSNCPATDLLVPPGTYLVNSNTTIAATLRFAAGATLKPASGKTITLGAPFTAPATQIFDLSLGGVVAVFAGMTRFFPEWWGALGNATANDSAAFNAAISAITGELSLSPARTYAVNLVLTKRGIKINGMTADNISVAGIPIKSLIPFDPTQPCIQIGTSSVLAGGITLENLSIWAISASGSAGTVGLSLVGAYGCNFNNISIGSSFSQHNLLLQSGSQPVSYNYFSGVQLWHLANINTVAVLGAYFGSSYTTANYFVNCNITGPGGTGTGYALEIDGVSLNMTNAWIQVSPNAGVHFQRSGSTASWLAGANIFIDSNSSSDVQITSSISSDTNAYPLNFLQGLISFSGLYKNAAGVTVSAPGAVWLPYQPVLTWPIVHGTLSLYNDTTGNTLGVAAASNANDTLNIGWGSGTGWTEIYAGSGGVYLAPGGTSAHLSQTTFFQPQIDNASNLGTPSNRWANVYAVNGTINTSDSSTKQDVAPLTAAEQAVARKLKTLVKTFRFIDAVKVKGDRNARRHIGLIAQDVLQAFSDENLDAAKYGLFCSDTWWEYDGCPVEADAEGNAEWVTYAFDGKVVREHEAHPENAKRTVQTVKAQSVTRLGMRYEEVLAFMLAAL